jgi:hypothetical protein
MQPDFLTPCLQAIFGTVGIHSLEFVRLDGMGRGPAAGGAHARCPVAWIERRLPRLLGYR